MANDTCRNKGRNETRELLLATILLALLTLTLI